MVQPLRGEMIGRWRWFENEFMPENISPDLKLIIEMAFFRGAFAAYDLRDEDDTEADIGDRLIGLSSQMACEREQFLKSPGGKGL